MRSGWEFNKISARDWASSTPILTPTGLGLRLLKLLIGLANPLLRSLSIAGDAGEMIETWSSRLMFSRPAKIAAVLSRTEGTTFFSCSVPFEWGMRWGFGGWLWVTGDDWGVRALISCSKIAEDDVYVIDTYYRVVTKWGKSHQMDMQHSLNTLH